MPTAAPTHVPTSAPTEVPTAAPTNAPTYSPTWTPTKAPTVYRDNCPPGTYADALDECTVAQLGRYANVTGATTAHACPAGAQCPRAGMTGFEPCGVGRFAAIDGMERCLTCSNGSRSERYNSSSACVECVAGRYDDDPTSPLGLPLDYTAECSKCEVGTYAPMPRAASCIDCRAGTVTAEAGAAVCVTCAAGRFTATLTSCVDCATSKYAAAAAATVCLLCETGRSVHTTAATACFDCNTPDLLAAIESESASSVPATTSCTVCAAGSRYSSGTARCELCVSGRYAPADAYGTAALAPPLGLACDAAPIGRYALGTGATSAPLCPRGHSCATPALPLPAPCSIGRFAPAEGLTECLDCPRGELTPGDGTGSHNCSVCGVGRYVPQPPTSVAALACAQCELGKHSRFGAATSCVWCAAGFYSDALGSEVCKECPAGHHCGGVGSTSVESAVPCAVGKFAPIGGLSICAACSAVRTGTITPASGATTCVTCAAGRFVADELTQTSCAECPPGRASEAAQTLCAMCATGRVAVGSGNDKCQSCTAGRFVDVATATASGSAGNATCAPCAVNSFSETDEAIACLECEVGDSTREKVGQTYCIRDAMICPVGTYLGWQTATSCTGCPSEGTICKESVLTIMPNWWFAPLDDLNINGERPMLDYTVPLWACLNEECCIAGVEIVDTQGKGDVTYHSVTCAEGYYGPLCGACDVKLDYLRSGTGCKKCWHYVLTYIAAGGMGLGLVGWLFWVVAFQDFSTEQGDHTGIVFKTLMSFCQMLTVLGIFKARGTALFNSVVRQPAQIVGGSLTSALPLKCIMKSQLYGGFVINIFTLPGMAAVTMLIIAPVWVGKVVYSRYIAGTPLPAAPTTTRTSCCRTRLTTKWERKKWTAEEMKKREGRWEPISRLQAVIVFVLFSIYPSLVKSVFSIVRCTESIHGKRYLDEDLSVQCWVGHHPSFVIAAGVAGIVYLVGAPVAVVILLHTNRNRLDEEGFRTTFSFLYNGYSTDRGSLVVGWEAIVMVRKFAITTIPVLSDDPYIQVLLALVLLVFSFGLQEHFHPFETELLNRLESMGLFTLIFTQIMSILYLYLDTYAAELGEKTVWLEVGVTIILMMANGIILSMMGGGIVIAFIQRREMHSRRRRAYEEQFVNGAWGGLSEFRNPRIEPALQLRVRADRDFRVLAKPDAKGDLTGEVVTKGSTILVMSQHMIKAYVRVGCRSGHRVNYMRRVDGRGWIVDPDPRTGTRMFEVVGRTVSKEGGMETARVWRCTPIVDRVPVQATASSWPYAVLTGEFLDPTRSVVVDMRIERYTFFARCRCRRWVTFLRLADGRGWVMEPSRMPLDGEEHTKCEMVRLDNTEDQARSSTEKSYLSEYVVTQACELWRDTKLNPELSPSGETLAAEQPILVSGRELRRRVKRGTVSLRPADERDPRHGDAVSKDERASATSFSMGKRRAMTFLKLADGRGWILCCNPVTGEPVVRFRGLRTDSLNFQGLPTLRLRYRVLTSAALPVLSEPLPKAHQVAALEPGSVVLVRDRAEVVRPFRTFVFLRVCGVDADGMYGGGAGGEESEGDGGGAAAGDAAALATTTGRVRSRSFVCPGGGGWIDVTNVRVEAPLLKPRGPTRRKRKSQKQSVGALQLLSSQLGECAGASSFVATGRRWVYRVPPDPCKRDGLAKSDDSAEAKKGDAADVQVNPLSKDAPASKDAEETKGKVTAEATTKKGRRWWGVPIHAPDLDDKGHPLVERLGAAAGSRRSGRGAPAPQWPAPIAEGSIIIASRRIVRSYVIATLTSGDVSTGQTTVYGTFVEIERVLSDKAAFTRWVQRATASFLAHDNSFGEEEEPKQQRRGDDDDREANTAGGATNAAAAAAVAAGIDSQEQRYFGKWMLTDEVKAAGARRPAGSKDAPPLLEFMQVFEPPFVLDSKQRDRRHAELEKHEAVEREQRKRTSIAAAEAHAAAADERKRAEEVVEVASEEEEDGETIILHS